MKALALRNKIRFFEILFATASRTLLQLGLDPDRCGALLGITAVLPHCARLDETVTPLEISDVGGDWT